MSYNLLDELTLKFTPAEFRIMKVNTPGPSGQLGGWPRLENDIVQRTKQPEGICLLPRKRAEQLIKYLESPTLGSGGPNDRVRRACVPALLRAGIKLNLPNRSPAQAKPAAAIPLKIVPTTTTKAAPAPIDLAETAEDRELAALIKRHGRTSHYQLIDITPAMAAAMLKRNRRNRTISPGWITKLARIIGEDRYLTTHQGFAFDWDGTLIDSQHRLDAIIKSRRTIKGHWVCFGLDPKVFEATDTGLRRTAQQFIQNHSEKPYSKTLASMVRLKCNLELAAANEEGTADEQMVYRRATELLGSDDRLLLAAKMGSQIHKIGSKHSAGLAYYIIATKSPHADRLPTFWEQLITGRDCQRGSAVLNLREHLAAEIKKKLRPWKGQTQYRTSQAAWIIQAWNAWLRGNKGKLQWNEPWSLPEVN